MEMDVVAALRLEFLNQAEVRHQIEIRAYELFLNRGCQHGHHEEDWLRAEQDVLGPLIRERLKLAEPIAIWGTVASANQDVKPRKPQNAKASGTKAQKSVKMAGHRITSKTTPVPALAKTGKTKTTSAKARQPSERTAAGIPGASIIPGKKETIAPPEAGGKTRTRRARTTKAAASTV